MAEEQKKNVQDVIKTTTKVVAGIALLVIGVLLVWLWRWEVLTLFKGCLGVVVILAGVIFLAIAEE